MLFFLISTSEISHCAFTQIWKFLRSVHEIFTPFSKAYLPILACSLAEYTSHFQSATFCFLLGKGSETSSTLLMTPVYSALPNHRQLASFNDDK